MVMMTRVNISVVNNFAAGPLDGYTILLANSRRGYSTNRIN